MASFRQILLLLLLLSFNAKGQNSFPNMYDRSDYRFGTIVRGKAIGFQILEDVLHLNFTGGLEFRFLNYHSIGVDWVYFRNRFENESYDSLKMEYYDNGFNDFDLRQYALIDYRFYLNFNEECPSIILPYITLFSKIGERHRWHQYRKIFSRYEPYNFFSSFKEYGIAGGVHIGFGGDSRGGLDINIGLIKAFSKLNYGDTEWQYGSNFKPERWKPHMRINFYYNLFKR